MDQMKRSQIGRNWESEHNHLEKVGAMMKHRTIVAACLALFATACGADDSKTPSAISPASECREEPCLAIPEQGFQLRSKGATIAPGEEVEYCEVLQLPGDPSVTHYVNRFESKTTSSAHHFTVVAISPGTPAEAAAVVGQRTICVAGPPGNYYDYKPVTNSQHPSHSNDFPPGVGRKFQGGQKLIFNYHYLNATSKAVPGLAAVNFHTVDASKVQVEPQDFGFINFGGSFSVPPKKTGAITTECKFSSDITIYKLIRHTHQWGTDFNVWYKGGPNDGKLTFSTPSYDQTDFVFPEPIKVKAGEGFRFECNYLNTEDHPLTFGPLATNEMCILMGVWWPTNPGENAAPQGCAVP
jgi:hypothetical protein